MQTVPDHKSRPISNVDHKTEATVVITVLTKQDKVMAMLRSLIIRLDILEKMIKPSAEEQLTGRPVMIESRRDQQM